MRTLLISILICTLTSGIYGQDPSNTDNSTQSAIVLSDDSTLFYIIRKNVTIKTPNGTSVTAGQLTSDDIPQTEKDALKDYFLNRYDNCITFESEATATYNCHAYAWYVSEGGSDVWLDSPETFLTDGSYDKVDDVTVDTKVYYSDGDHSGNVYSTSSDGTFTVESKWGCAPRFIHSPSDCPYTSTNLVYFVENKDYTEIGDGVSIMNPPSCTPVPPGTSLINNTTIMSPCTNANASFFAGFSSGGGLSGDQPTSPSDFKWSLNLYYSGGSYTYSSGTTSGYLLYPYPCNSNPNNSYSPNGTLWQPTLGTVPNYAWTYDNAGNIMGEVDVTVDINDGTTTSASAIIGVNPNTLIQNVTYSSNTTVNSCGPKMELINVTVNNNAKVIFNTNGTGIIINAPFQATAGSAIQTYSLPPTFPKKSGFVDE